MPDEEAASQPDLDEDEQLSVSVEDLKEAFPELKCLRCGCEDFFLVGPPLSTQRVDREYRIGIIHFYGGQPKTVRLICQRCGMIEEHSEDILGKAEKPIKRDN